MLKKIVYKIFGNYSLDRSDISPKSTISYSYTPEFGNKTNKDAKLTSYSRINNFFYWLYKQFIETELFQQPHNLKQFLFSIGLFMVSKTSLNHLALINNSCVLFDFTAPNVKKPTQKLFVSMCLNACLLKSFPCKLWDSFPLQCSVRRVREWRRQRKQIYQ